MVALMTELPPDPSPRPALPWPVLNRYAAELQSYLRREAAPQLDGADDLGDDLDGYASDTSLSGAGGTPRGSYIRPAAYTARVEQAVDDAARARRRLWAVQVDHVWWGRWREAIEALPCRDEQQVIGYCLVDGLTQEQAGALLRRGVSWVSIRQHEGLRHMVGWFWRAGTLDGRCVRGRWQ